MPSEDSDGRCSHIRRGKAFASILHVRLAKTLISLRTAQADLSLLSPEDTIGSLATNTVPCEDADQTARMRKSKLKRDSYCHFLMWFLL